MIKGRTSYQATQMLAPPTLIGMGLVEILEQHDKRHEHADQRRGPYQPPGPPHGLAGLEEADGFFGKPLEPARVHGDAGLADGGVRGYVGANTPSQDIRGVEETDAKDQAHEEATDVGEVIEPRQQAQDERDGDVEDQPGEIYPRPFAFAPVVEQVQQHECDDAEQ